MDKMEIFYLILLAICFGTITIYTLMERIKGKAKMLQRRRDDIRKKEEFKKKAPDAYKEIYENKEERQK